MIVSFDFSLIFWDELEEDLVYLAQVSKGGFKVGFKAVSGI